MPVQIETNDDHLPVSAAISHDNLLPLDLRESQRNKWHWFKS